MQSVNSIIINEIIRQSAGMKSPVNRLVKILSMSRETAYRRIRNQIPFSVDEVVVIAKHFNLSLDKLLDLKSEDSFSNKNFNVEREPEDIYSGLIGDDIEIMEKLLASKNVKITAALNSMPFRFLPHKSLFKLDYCHYLHSVGKISLVTTCFSDIEVPTVIDDLHEKSIACFNRLNNITCIVDNMLFSGIIKKIQYYHRLKFISDEDLQHLQSEMFELLKAYENLLRNGKNSAGSNYTFYYSFFNFESNIIFYEYDDNSLLQIWVYPESPILIKNNNQVNTIQKRWIDSKIRNSILITKSADANQIEMIRDVYHQIEELFITPTFPNRQKPATTTSPIRF